MLGFVFIVGIALVFINMSELKTGGETNGIILFGIGIVLMTLIIIDRQFKQNSDLNQGMFDRAFAAYLVKHVPTTSEGSFGWAARLESMGDWGDRFAERQAQREQKNAEKRAAKDAAAAQSAAETEASGSDSDSDDGADEDAD